MAQWLQPLRPQSFERGWSHTLGEGIARLVGQRHIFREGIYDGRRLVAAFNLTARLWGGTHRLTLLVHPDYRGRGWEEGMVERALGLLARYPRRAVITSHLTSHGEALAALCQRRFRTVRSLVTMRRWMPQTDSAPPDTATPP